MDGGNATTSQTARLRPDWRSECCSNVSKYDFVTMLRGSITGCET